MWSQQIFVALLSLSLTLQHVTAVVNNGQSQTIEESLKSENKDDQSKTDASDLVAESSESANRREASISSSYGAPPVGSSVRGNYQLPVPVYGIPNSPNNIVYPAPPPDIPPPLPKLPPASLYGPPTFGKTYGLPQVNNLSPPSKGYGAPYPVKFGAPPAYSFNQFSANLNSPKATYGPPKIKYHKYPPKNFGYRPPKPVYGSPIAFKENNFNYNKHHLNNNNNYLGTNNFNSIYKGNLFTNDAFSTNSFSNNLYSGVSSLSHQYGAPILPSKPSLQYGPGNIGISTQYGLPDKVASSGNSLSAYGPPQPSSNPKPPHPGAPAPPTPPDIKYDGWQPIPGLVSKRPLEEANHLTVEGSGYQDLSPPPLHKDLGDTYRAPPVTLDISHGTSLLSQPGLSDSYGVPLTGSKGLSDSYNAPLGTVTGSGGVVASSGTEALRAQYNTHSSSHGINSGSSSQGINFGLDLSSTGIGHGPDIESVKSIEYDITPPQGVSVNIGGSAHQISDSYGAPQSSALSGSNSHSSGQSYHSIDSSSQSYKGGFNSNSYKSSSPSSAPVGLVPPSGVYGATPSSQYGTLLYTNTHHSNYKPSNRPGLYTNSGSSGSSYLPPPSPSNSYGVPSNSGAAISYQNVVHGSSTAGVNYQQNSLNTEGANVLPLTSYNVPLGAIDGSYSFSSHGDNTVSLDYSHPGISLDLTQAKQHDCNHQPLQGPSVAYGGPSAEAYSSSVSSLATNIATSHAQTVVPQSTFEVPSSQYGVPDLLHSSSVKTEAKSNSISIENDGEAHGKSYGKSVAESFGPNSELVESQSIDLNNIPLQGNLGSYTLQIQSSDGGSSQVPHTQVLNEGLLQSILQAIEQPGKQNQNAKYPIILQPSVESNSDLSESNQQASDISEVTVDPPKENTLDDKSDNVDNEETLQLLDTSNIALYYKKDDGIQKMEKEEKTNDNSAETSS